MKRTGRQDVINRIIREAKTMLYGGIILTTLWGLLDCMILFFAVLGARHLAEPLYFFSINVVFGIILMIIGNKNMSHPEESRFLKRNPDLFKQADQLFSNIIYEDKNVIISDKVIANKNNILQMEYLKDIISIYRSSVHSNQLVLENKDKKNTVKVYIYPKRNDKREKVLQLLSAYCPEARFGVGIEEVPPLTQIENNNYSQF